jgi:hypothetical protein
LLMVLMMRHLSQQGIKCVTKIMHGFSGLCDF